MYAKLGALLSRGRASAQCVLSEKNDEPAVKNREMDRHTAQNILPWVSNSTQWLEVSTMPTPRMVSPVPQVEIVQNWNPNPATSTGCNISSSFPTAKKPSPPISSTWDILGSSFFSTRNAWNALLFIPLKSGNVDGSALADAEAPGGAVIERW